MVEDARLVRIEEKIDKITDAVNGLTTSTAVMHTKIEDLEVRRAESHARANRFSERMDHMHECMHDVKAQVGVSTKVLYGVGAAVGVAIINEIIQII
jgi:archaellum component FlaC